MLEVCRLGLRSVFRLGFFVFGAFGLLLGLFLIGVSSLLGLLDASAGQAAFLRVITEGGRGLLGPATVLLLALVWGLVGGLVSAGAALIYNVAASWGGGIRLEYTTREAPTAGPAPSAASVEATGTAAEPAPSLAPAPSLLTSPRSPAGAPTAGHPTGHSVG